MSGDILAIHSEAEADVQTAFEFLEEERPGHGYLFLERYREAIQDAIEFPAMGYRVRGYLTGLDVRKYPLTQFSYSLVVALVGGRRTIVAVQHHTNSEDYFRERLE